MTARRWDPAWVGSASKVKRYERCPLSFRFRYVDRLPDPTGSAGRVGLLVHGALERVCRARVGLKSPGAAQVEELLRALGEAVHEVEGLEPGDLAEARYVVEMLAPFDPSGGGEILGAEVPWSLDVGEGVLFGGYWDLVRRTEAGIVEVVDWKTGQRPTNAELAVDAQLGLYLAAAYRTFDEDDVAVTFVYVGSEHVRPATVPWDAETDALAVGRAFAAYKAWSRGHFPARVDLDTCRFCLGRERCNALAEALQPIDLEGERPAPRSLPTVELLDERVYLHGLAKAAEARRKDLDREIKVRLEEEGVERIETDAAKAFPKSRRSGRFDVAVLPELAATLGRDPYEVLRIAGSVSAEGLKKLTKGNEDAQKLVEGYRMGAPSKWIEVRKVKGVL